eukprot:5675986-Prymnesium_polylepis.1
MRPPSGAHSEVRRRATAGTRWPRAAAASRRLRRRSPSGAAPRLALSRCSVGRRAGPAQPAPCA